MSTSDTTAAGDEVTPPATAPAEARRSKLDRLVDRVLFPGGGALALPLTIGAACLVGAYVRTLLTPDARFVLVVVVLGLLVVVPVAIAIVGEMR